MSKNDIVQLSIILDGMQEARVPRLALADRLSKMGASIIEKVTDNLKDFGDSIRLTIRVEAWSQYTPREQTVSWRLAEAVMQAYGQKILPKEEYETPDEYAARFNEATTDLYEKIRRQIKEIV